MLTEFCSRPGTLCTDGDILSEEEVATRFNLKPGETLFSGTILLTQLRARIDLQAHSAVAAFRYGITDHWDISVAVPVVNTFLRVRTERATSGVEADSARARFFFARNAEGGRAGASSFGPRNPETLDSVARDQIPFIQTGRRAFVSPLRKTGAATGVGDITLRTKYHLWDTEAGGAALGLNLQLPTGEEDDFQGLDETHVSPFLYLSQVFLDRFEPHLNIGVDLNADDVERSSFLWAAGVAVLVWEQLGIGIDFIGRSEFEGVRLRIPRNGFYTGAALTQDPTTCTESAPCQISSTPRFPFFPVKVGRNDIIDCAFSVRYGIGRRGSIFFGMIVPLNSDGFRADFIPAGGVLCEPDRGSRHGFELCPICFAFSAFRSA